MNIFLALISLFGNHNPEPVVTPEALIITPDFDAVFIPEGFEGPVVALPLDVEVF